MEEGKLSNNPGLYDTKTFYEVMGSAIKVPLSAVPGVFNFSGNRSPVGIAFS